MRSTIMPFLTIRRSDYVVGCTWLPLCMLQMLRRCSHTPRHDCLDSWGILHAWLPRKIVQCVLNLIRPRLLGSAVSRRTTRC